MTRPGILWKNFFNYLFNICDIIICIFQGLFILCSFFQFYWNIANHSILKLFLKIFVVPEFPSFKSSFILLASMLLSGFDPPHLPPTPSLTPRGPPSLSQEHADLSAWAEILPTALSPASKSLALVLVYLMLEEESVVSWGRGWLLCCPTISFSLACAN